MTGKAATKRAGGICVLLLALVVLIVGNDVVFADLLAGVVDTEVNDYCYDTHISGDCILSNGFSVVGPASLQRAPIHPKRVF